LFILGNKNEENCSLYIFKNSNLNPSSSSSKSSNSSILVGQAQINFYKDNFFSLCEYLFHSVYDSESLENFDLKQYFINSGYLVDWSEKEAASYVKTLTKKSILKQKEKDLTFLSNLNIDYTNSSFISYYLSYLDTKFKRRINFSLTYLDDKLSKAFKVIALPTDWTVLGQNCYLNKCKLYLCSYLITFVSLTMSDTLFIICSKQFGINYKIQLFFLFWTWTYRDRIDNVILDCLSWSAWRFLSA